MGPLFSLSGVGVVERQERAKTRATQGGNKNSIWIIICLPFRQRLTAGALVCDQLDVCAFNKPSPIAFVLRAASGHKWKALKKQTNNDLTESLFAFCFVCRKDIVLAVFTPTVVAHYSTQVNLHTPVLKYFYQQRLKNLFSDCVYMDLGIPDVIFFFFCLFACKHHSLVCIHAAAFCFLPELCKKKECTVYTPHPAYSHDYLRRYS